MGLDLWFRADVARLLQATHETMCSTAAAMAAGLADDPDGRQRAAAYRQGFGAALRAVATAFGLTEADPACAPGWRRPPDMPELTPLTAAIDRELTGGDWGF